MARKTQAQVERQRYRQATRALAFVALLCILAGVQFLADPSTIADTAAGQRMPFPFDHAWALCFLLAGVLVVYGTQAPHPRLERSGLVLLTGAVILNGWAITLAVGFTPTIILHVLCAGLFVERVRLITHLDHAAAEASWSR